MSTHFRSRPPASREGYVPVDNAELSYREIGQGRPMIVIHGGSDFDRTYLLPDMDRLSDSYRLIYYDQKDEESHGVIYDWKTSVSRNISKIWTA